MLVPAGSIRRYRGWGRRGRVGAVGTLGQHPLCSYGVTRVIAGLLGGRGRRRGGGDGYVAKLGIARTLGLVVLLLLLLGLLAGTIARHMLTIARRAVTVARRAVTVARGARTVARGAGTVARRSGGILAIVGVNISDVGFSRHWCIPLLLLLRLCLSRGLTRRRLLIVPRLSVLMLSLLLIVVVLVGRGGTGWRRMYRSSTATTRLAGQLLLNESLGTFRG